MSFLHMRSGLPRDSELMATEQECSNSGLALVSGQSTQSVIWRKQQFHWLLGCILRHCTPLLLPRASTLRWTPSAPFPSGKSESESGTDSQAVCFLAQRLCDSYYKAQYYFIQFRFHCVTKMLFSFCLFHTCSALVIMYCDPGDKCDG